MSRIGNDQCVGKYVDDKTKQFGFQVGDDCKQATLEVKWKNDAILFITIRAQAAENVRFKVFVSDQCTLDITSEKNEAEWTLKVGEYAAAETLQLKISGDGRVLSTRGLQVGCDDKTVRTDVDNQWVWTQIRMDVPEEVKGFWTTIYTKNATDVAAYEPLPTPEPTTASFVHSTVVVKMLVFVSAICGFL